MELTLLCSLFIPAICNSIIDVQYPIFSSQLHLIEHALADAPPLDTPKSSGISDREESHYDSENNCFDNHNTENHDLHDDKEYIKKFWICVAILTLLFIGCRLLNLFRYTVSEHPELALMTPCRLLSHLL